MQRLLSRALIVFAAGCFGGLVNSLAVWAFGMLGVTAAFGVQIAPQLSAQWLYPRIVWGGLWGALFLSPLPRRGWWWRGLMFSLGPTAVQLLVVFPENTRHGLFGLGLGLLTPAFVALFNAAWGLAAALVLRIASRG